MAEPHAAAREALRTVRGAIDASYHIAECADHPEHLRIAEEHARVALPALLAVFKHLDALAAELASVRAELEQARERVAALETALAEAHGVYTIHVCDECGRVEGERPQAGCCPGCGMQSGAHPVEVVAAADLASERAELEQAREENRLLAESLSLYANEKQVGSTIARNHAAATLAALASDFKPSNSQKEVDESTEEE